MKRIGIVILLFALLLAACQAAQEPAPPVEGPSQEVEVAGGSYKDVGPQELNAMLAEKDFAFVNVHIPYEGEIAKTDEFIPYNEIGANLDQLPEDRDAKIVLYCRSDRMSRIAAEELVGLGYTNIWNLDGGMAAWEVAGYNLEGR